MGMENELKAKIAAGKTVFGSWSMIPSPMVANVMAESGIDFLIADMEHGPISLETLENMINATEAGGSTLIGAKMLLEDTLGIEIEIEFIEIYKDQPKFAEVSSWLEGQGFTLLDFVNIYRWQRDSFDGLGQVIFIEGLFIKSPETVIHKNLNIEKMNSYFIILLLYKRTCRL